MKKIIFSLAFTGLFVSASAQEKGIRFEQNLSWKQVKEKAKAENRFIFLDAFATWCLPCRYMDDSIYLSEKVGAFMNDKFMAVKVQMDTTPNDNDLTRSWRNDVFEINKEYKITAYPSFLFFTPDGRLVHKATGAMNDTTFINTAKDALDPKKQFYVLLEQYKAGKLSFAEMPHLAKYAGYLKETAEADKIAKNYTENYLLKLKENKLFTKENLEFIREFIGNTNSRGFKFFVQQKSKINKVLGKNMAEYAIRSVIAKQFIPEERVWERTRPDWDLLEKKITAKFGSLGQETVYGRRMIYYLTIKDWKKYGTYYRLYFKSALERPEWIVNNLSFYLFLNVNDPEVLQFASEVVMKYAIEEWYQNDIAAWDTYANLLYKTGKIKAAIEWEEKAVGMAKGQSNEKEYVDILKKMKAGKPTWEAQ